MGEIINAMGIILCYFFFAALGAFLLRRFASIPDEVFRKLLHFILLGSLLIGTLSFDTWYLAACSALGFAIAVYPILMLAQRIKGYSETVTERRPGELKSSLLVVFIMYALVVTVCWGWRGEKLLALCSIYAWGFGDAAAALVGKKWGRHPLEGKHIEGRKSLEGTLAMFAVSFVCVFVIISIRGGMEWYGYLLTAVLTAGASAAAELYTLKGLDTITCPVVAMTVILIMVRLFS